MKDTILAGHMVLVAKYWDFVWKSSSWVESASMLQNEKLFTNATMILVNVAWLYFPVGLESVDGANVLGELYIVY